MKNLEVIQQDKRLSPLKEVPAGTGGCGCGASQGKDRAVEAPRQDAGYITGTLDTPSGSVSRVATEWSAVDRWGEVKCRIGSFRNHYAVPAGLYAVGNPGSGSEVLVSANYKLSFDKLRRELSGRDLWILVIDTDGINVWCAAGKGTFGTEELAARIARHGVADVVTHRRIIVPQLGAPGIDAAEIRRRTGFRVSYGPVRASDLPAYLDAGLRATEKMRRVTFGMADRLVLTPIELVPVLKAFPLFALLMLIAFGLDRTGIRFDKALHGGTMFIVLGLGAALAGAFLTPALLPFIPGRSFAVKGWIAGAAVTALLAAGTGGTGTGDAALMAFTGLLFPSLSSFLALQFTGATTYTNISGVAKELKIAVPLYAAAVVLSLAALVLHIIMTWGNV